MAKQAIANPIKYEDLKGMTEKDFMDWIKGNPEYKAWAKEAIKRTEKRETYPRKKVYDDNGNPVKKISEKTGKEYIVHEADYTKKPKISYKPISFLSLKKAFAFECLGVEKVVAEEKETFHDRLSALLDEE